MRKSCVVPPSSSKFPRSRSVCDRETAKMISVSFALLSPFKSSAEKSNSPPPSARTRQATAAAALMEEEREAPKSISKLASPKHSKVERTEKSSSLIGRLCTLSKEAMQQRETAQKIALQALREATVTETVVRHLKTLANLSKSAKPDCPAACFENFLEFHKQISETITKRSHPLKQLLHLLVRTDLKMGQLLVLKLSPKLVWNITAGLSLYLVSQFL